LAYTILSFTSLYKYTNNERTDKVNEIKKADLKKPITYEAGATSDNKFAKEWIEFLKSKN
jgi:molybdate transport system substrate-binding protein